MRLIKGLQRWRLMAIALVVACAVAGGVAAWHASRLPAEASSDKAASKAKQDLQERVRKGVGSEVKFASAGAKPDQIAEAVASAADFIFWRSGLRMSDETKKELAAAESNVLNGKTKPITIEDLTGDMTAAVADGLATITDEEIQVALDQSSDQNGEVWTQVDGQSSVLLKKEFIKQTKVVRELSERGGSMLQTLLRPAIEVEVNDRVSTLATALPRQFGQARAQGITPTQALLIAYSVAADDPLTDSRSDITQQIAQQRIDARQTREQKRAQKNVSGRPYGPHGLLHAAYPQLFFTRTAMGKFVNLSEGGTK